MRIHISRVSRCRLISRSGPVLGAVIGLVLLTSMAAPCRGQNYRLRDGRVLAASAVVVRGNQLMRLIEVKSGGVAEVGYPLSEVISLEWPEPEELRRARERLHNGVAEQALADASAVVARFAPFATLPGSWWSEAERLRLKALVALGRFSEIRTAAQQLFERSQDETTRQTASLILARVAVLERRWPDARRLIDLLLKTTLPPALEAEAAVIAGELKLHESDWEGALESFLQLPAFHPAETGLLPKALLGSSRAYRRLGDAGRAERATLELIDQFPKSTEAREAARETGL